MITQKDDFKDDVVGFLLFSSMSKPSEQYLSKEFKGKTDNKFKNLKTIISKVKDKKRSLFSGKADRSLDSEIETTIEDIKKPEQENRNFLDGMLDYNSKEEETKDLVKSPST